MPHLARLDMGVMGGVYASDFTQRVDIYQSHQRERHAGICAVGATFHDRHAARSRLGNFNSQGRVSLDRDTM